MTEPEGTANDSGDQTAGPPPLPTPFAREAFKLGGREELVALELERIDRQLAGLFRIGLELCSRGDASGLSYVIAEAGRELNVGIINFLAEGAPELTDAEVATIADGERHRGPIAKALRLHPQHPLVTAWLEMHQRLNGEAHFVANRTTTSTAASDFRELASLLAGRVAPYFDAQDEADAVLAVERPGPEHLVAVRRILVRPALRRYFLQKLEDPAWLPLLERLQAFDNPPSRVVHEDGSWSMVPWLEGEYLVRVAASEPSIVAAHLEAVPLTNDNPAVWDVAARAAAALPANRAARVLSHIALGVRAVPRVVLPNALLALGDHVSTVDSASVLLLLNTLLWMRRREETAQDVDGEELRRYRHSTSWLLERIDIDDAQEALDRLVPAIARSNPRGALTLLGEKLRAAMRGINPGYADESARDAAWGRELDDSEASDDLRTLIARGIARVGSVLAAASAEDAAWVIEFLSTLPKGIGQRLQYLVVARAAPQLVAEVESLLRRADVFEWEMPGREVGEILRSRFTDAGIDAQQEFLRTLERGPGEDELQHLVEWSAKVGRDASPEAALAYWQRRQLLRFGARLPESLAGLAERLAYVPAQPDARDLDLVEVGWSSGSGGWVADGSPFSTDALLEGPAAEVARAIREWVPEGGIDRPTLRGLEDALGQLADSAPDRAIEIAHALLEAGSSRGVSGVLHGLAQRYKRGADSPISSIGDLLGSILEDGPAGAEWLALQSSAIDVASDVILGAAPERAAEFFRLGARFLGDPRLWPAAEEPGPTSVDGVIGASINVLSGMVTQMVIRFAMADYNHRRTGHADGSAEAEEVRADVSAHLLPAIQTVLPRTGRSAIAARAIVGTYLPQLVWFAPEWWSAQAAALLDGAIEHPTRNPIWAAYLARAPFFDSTFARMRTWYSTAVATPIQAAATSESRTWEPARHLVEHVLSAVLRGLARVGDADHLVENAFTHAIVEDLTHGYWTVFRGWTDAAEKGQTLPADYVTRLRQLWEWRLSQMEEAPDSERRAEEANGLLWFCRTPFIPTPDVIALGIRTLRLVRDASGTLHALWERLGELAEADPDGAFVMTERAVAIELTSRWARVPDDDLGSVFQAVFSKGSASTRVAALRLLNELGDAGHPEFGRFRPDR